MNSRFAQSQMYGPFSVPLAGTTRSDWEMGDGIVVGLSELTSSAVKYVMLQGTPVMSGLGTEAFEMGVRGFLRQAAPTFYGGSGLDLIVLEPESRKAVRVVKTLVAVKEKGVVIGDADFEKLRQFLGKQSALAELIAALAPKLTEKFSDCEVSLELYTSKSSGESYPAFFLRRGQYEKGFMAGIRSFQREFEALLSSAQGWLSVTTDFRPPRSRV
jgi:hypothetical protein